MYLDKKTIEKREQLITSYIEKSSGVLHLGAHKGQERAQYDKLNKKVIWVEANPIIFKELTQNLIEYPLQEGLCALLGNVDGTTQDFYLSNNSDGASSSIFKFGKFGTGAQSLWPNLNLQMMDTLSLSSISLDTLLKKNHKQANKFNFWVIDLQGAEHLLLEGAKKSILTCQALLVEISTVEVYKNAATWDTLLNTLTIHGFSPAWQPERAHDDVLFIRDKKQKKALHPFLSKAYLAHNQCRLEHLSSLELDLSQKTVLEVGAGIGDHTAFYIDRKCQILTTEGRKENLHILKKRFYDIDTVQVKHLDLSMPKNLNQKFEIIHCYGLLYHVSNPSKVLQFLAEHCSGILLLETCLSLENEEKINLLNEPIENPTQSLEGLGCRPSRPWVWKELKKIFPYVYATKKQPIHNEFPLDWSPKKFQKNTLTRAVFIASHRPLNSEQLVPFLPLTYTH